MALPPLQGDLAKMTRLHPVLQTFPEWPKTGGVRGLDGGLMVLLAGTRGSEAHH